jgi:hypothetical protein
MMGPTGRRTLKQRAAGGQANRALLRPPDWDGR